MFRFEIFYNVSQVNFSAIKICGLQDFSDFSNFPNDRTQKSGIKNNKDLIRTDYCQNQALVLRRVRKFRGILTENNFLFRLGIYWLRSC